MTIDDLKEIARQLANPEGEKGVDMGRVMYESNIAMTRNTLRHLELQDRDVVLELGHGNAHHLAEFHGHAADLTYHGLDVSATMKSEGEAYANKHGLTANSTFTIYNGTDIPFPDRTFDRIFSVNTIYFWNPPEHLLRELSRVLKSGGRMCITFADKSSMDNLPFTAYGFTKYTSDTFKALISKSQFKILSMTKYSEKIKSKSREEVKRIYFVATLEKD